MASITMSAEQTVGSSDVREEIQEKTSLKRKQVTCLVRRTGTSSLRIKCFRLRSLQNLSELDMAFVLKCVKILTLVGCALDADEAAWWPGLLWYLLR